MCDKLVFDLAQEVEGTPNVFVRKDWINILDNQNQNYSNNQSVIDTSQLSNSNKYMSYRESYLLVPMTLTLAQSAITFGTTAPTAGANQAGALLNPVGDAPATRVGAVNYDYSLGLKNWFGQIIHSMTLDYNGTTICQQTPYINMWNSFKLLTSLSLQDLKSQGSTIGFYPDSSASWGFYPSAGGSALNAVTTNAIGDSLSGDGVCNNTNFDGIQVLVTLGNMNSMQGNNGFLERQRLIAFDTDVPSAGTFAPSVALNIEQQLITKSRVNEVWRSYVSAKQNSVYSAAPPALATAGFVQWSVVATIYLKHIHSFFNMCPLLKGVFMKLTLNLNNSSSTIVTTSSSAGAGATVGTGLHVSSSSNAIGGVNPLMVASALPNQGAFNLPGSVTASAAGTASSTYIVNLSVGATILDNTIGSLPNVSRTSSINCKSIYLYTPAYTFNPVFEQAYLSNPVKQIKYTDVYQYQVLNVGASGATFNNLITNGIANIKSVLILPFFSTSAGAQQTPVANVRTAGSANPTSTVANTGLPAGMPVWQSPFDPAGSGPTSPLCSITNFNVQISGQNAIYNLQKYNFEQFNNQLYGQNAVNGGLTDGLTSGLIDRFDFDSAYCCYYVNVERMLPVEMSVPKSVQIIGQNQSLKAIDLYVFIEYGVEISIDALTGARV